MTGPTDVHLPAAMMSVVSCARSRTGTGIAPRSCSSTTAHSGCARARGATRRPGPGAWRRCARRSRICRRCRRGLARCSPLCWPRGTTLPRTRPASGTRSPSMPITSTPARWRASARSRSAEIDQFQDALAEVVLERVHASAPAADEPLSVHLVSVVDHALGALEADPDLARLVRAESIRLNGKPQAGPRAAFARASADSALLAALDAEPQVRLHGDLLLENVLWRRPDMDAVSGSRPAAPADRSGVGRRRHERPAAVRPREVRVLRDGRAGGLAIRLGGRRRVRRRRRLPYGVRWQSAELAAFRSLDWHTRFRRAFEARYGPVDGRAYRLHRRLLQRGDGGEHGRHPAPRAPAQGHTGLQRRRERGSCPVIGRSINSWAAPTNEPQSALLELLRLIHDTARGIFVRVAENDVQAIASRIDVDSGIAGEAAVPVGHRRLHGAL